jgi:ferredoxin
MKANVDDERCRGHGVCASLCPDVFALTDDGYAVAADSDVPAELEEAVSDAVHSCPEQAISTD